MGTTVREYFDRIHDDFDSIYREKKSPMKRFIDGAFRRSIDARFRHVLALQRTQKFARILDVGCGSGRYAAALASLGATEVVGIDLSAAMVADAKAFVEQAGVGSHCTFLHADFLEYVASEPFDLGVAMGVFDYTPDPEPLLRKLGTDAANVVASFPVRAHPLTPVRKLRLGLKGVPIRFYSRRDIVRAFEKAGLGAPVITRLHRDFVAEGGRAVSAGTQAASPGRKTRTARA